MDLIYADENKEEIGFISDFVKLDAEIDLDADIGKNRFDLTMDESVWEKSPIRIGHYLYVPQTEWGGPVELIKHITKSGQIILSGPTWRGMVTRKVIEPPAGQTHMDISGMEANVMLQHLISDQFGDLISISEENSDRQVSGRYRYTVLLEGIETALQAAGMALSCAYDNIARRVIMSARIINDHSSLVDLSQDYGIYLTSREGGIEAYNHVIALGRGEMLEREILHLYRLDNGEITTESPGHLGARDIVRVYDYSNAESSEELFRGAKKLLEESAPLRTVEMDTAETDLTLSLGDKVSARDRLTGLVTVATVRNQTLVITATGEKIETKVG